MNRFKEFCFLPQWLASLSQISSLWFLTPEWSELRWGCQYSMPSAPSLGLASWSHGYGRGQSASSPYLQTPWGMQEDIEQIILTSAAPLMPRTPEGWEAFVAILISQVQRGLRDVSTLSSLLSFCILSVETQVSMEHIQKGDQERNYSRSNETLISLLLPL